jgi:hypothetical protein
MVGVCIQENPMPRKVAKKPAPKLLPAPAKVGWSIQEWCAALNLGRSTFYLLPAELRPKILRIGDRQIVIEAPSAYAERVAAMQAKAA